MPNLRNGSKAKGDSNPGSLDCESGILPLSYCAPYSICHTILVLVLSSLSLSLFYSSSYIPCIYLNTLHLHFEGICLLPGCIMHFINPLLYRVSRYHIPFALVRPTTFSAAVILPFPQICHPLILVLPHTHTLPI